MLAGASPSLRRQLSLKTVKDYRYLSQGVVPLEDVSEVDEFHRLKRSLAMLGLAEELQNRCVYMCVCSCVAGCGMVWCGVVCGAVRCGAVRCGVAWRGVAWRGVAWRGVVWYTSKQCM